MNQTKYEVLVVDDDPGMRLGMAETLKRSRRCVVEQAENAEKALQILKTKSFHMMITDMRMPGLSGLELLKKVKTLQPAIEVIVVTAYGTIETAVEAIKCGAYDYILKPFSAKDLMKMVDAAMANEAPINAFRPGKTKSRLVTNSPKLLNILEVAKRAANSTASVLIQAESGTGKELLAKFIFEHSPRANQPLVAVNCAALPDNLLESELFGFEKGSFTGATNSKPGKFELANGGTLLLDEIGEMPPALQSKLLRVLQEREVDRIGGKSPISVDVRVIAMTNQKLKEKIEQGEFREDLYYRLNVIPLHIPPLRDRVSDVDVLCQHFIKKYNTSTQTKKVSTQALQILKKYDWPGNVRELENMVQRALILSSEPVLEANDLFIQDETPRVRTTGATDPIALKAGTSVHEMERKLIEITLEETGGNKTQAAQLLGISLRTLRNKLNQYDASNN
ncbi:MAG: sigma-54-dependent Fis family transcriptional regulator [Acidobacteria bacterium]|nr:MAG: sigma-54-dependent Fis family transcriptional regulator [Acidobacteriota bacterium]